MLKDFFKGKRVFLTGHNGFKGTWLSLWLLRLGAEVGAYSLSPPSDPSLCSLVGCDDNVTRLGGDIRDEAALLKAMTDFRPDMVIHMAAQSLVRSSYDEPVETFSTNVMGTVHVLEAARRFPEVQGVLIVTSDKCYENREWIWGYRECDPMGGHDPYSASKGCAELVTASYMKSFFDKSGVAVASVRAGNVIGGGDFAKDRLVPDLVRAIDAGEPIVIRFPEAVRPWQHVLEPLYGYMILLKRLFEDGQKYAGGWNFGPPDESVRTVGDVVETFASHWNGDVKVRIMSEGSPHEASWLKLDCSKARNMLGWKPRLDFDGSLRLAAHWYKQWIKGGDVRTITLEQIAMFEEME